MQLPKVPFPLPFPVPKLALWLEGGSGICPSTTEAAFLIPFASRKGWDGSRGDGAVLLDGGQIFLI